ncbi:MAG: sugar transferase [Candidatus Hydrogenedentes bacterium]|nr:sugar transferase [Candidatus Hydrogenedentota bacterium]
MKTIYYILTDSVLIVYCYVGATIARIAWGAPIEMVSTLLYSMVPFSAIHVSCLYGARAYDFSKIRNTGDLAFSTAIGTVCGSGLSFAASTIVIYYYAPSAQPIGRTVFALAFVLSLVLLVGWRAWYRKQCHTRGDLHSRIVIVGDAKRVGTLSTELQEYSKNDVEITGWLAFSGEDSTPSDGCLGLVDDLPQILEKHRPDEVLVFGDLLASNPERILDLMSVNGNSDVRVHIVPGPYESIVGKLDVYEIGGVPLIALCTRPLSGLYPHFKRIVDVVCATFGLLVASPLLLVSIILIKLDSPGPAFYFQVRSGLRGREFNIVKLRSMSVDAESASGPQWAQKNDPRVTRVGKFLRRRRIDEIPQFWNVLRGDMSLVGPRPERPSFVEKFSQELPLFRLRLLVRPGLTATSHVLGRYDSKPADRLRYDLSYISNMSFMLDLRVLIETVKIVLTGRGAQ